MAEQNINIEDLNEETNTTEDTSVEDRNAAEANTEASDAKENDGSLVKDGASTEQSSSQSILHSTSF